MPKTIHVPSNLRLITESAHINGGDCCILRSKKERQVVFFSPTLVIRVLLMVDTLIRELIGSSSPQQSSPQGDHGMQ